MSSCNNTPDINALHPAGSGTATATVTLAYSAYMN